MKTATEKRIAFRNMLKSGEIIVAPGIGDALSAKIAAYAGIKALTMGGYSVSASSRDRLLHRARQPAR